MGANGFKLNFNIIDLLCLRNTLFKMYSKLCFVLFFYVIISYSCSPTEQKLPLRKIGLHGVDNFTLGMTLSDAKKLIKIKEKHQEFGGIVIRTEDDIVLTFKKAKSNFPWVRPELQLHTIFLDTVDSIPTENYRLVTLNRIEGLSESEAIYDVNAVSKISEKYGLPVYNELETGVSYAPTPHDYAFIFPGEKECLRPSSVFSITQFAPQNSYQKHLAGVSWNLRDSACIDSRPYFPLIWGSDPYALDFEKSYPYRNKFVKTDDTLMVRSATNVFSLPDEKSTPNFEISSGILVKFEYRSKSNRQDGKSEWYYHNQVGFISGNNLLSLNEIDDNKIASFEKQDFQDFKEAVDSCNKYKSRSIPQELQTKLSLFFKIHENQFYKSFIEYDSKTEKYQIRDSNSGQVLPIEVNSGVTLISKTEPSLIRMNWDFRINELEGECFEHSCEEIYACALIPSISIFDSSQLKNIDAKKEIIPLPRIFQR